MYIITNIFSIPTHKWTTGRALVWGSEFNIKVAKKQGGSAEIANTLNIIFWVLVTGGDVLPLSW